MGEEEVLPVYYLFPKGEERLLDEVNTIIADMVEDGTIAEIFSHFGLTDPHLVTGFSEG
jgi:ABC-type amino acid transport substrate-binding protein